MSVYVMGDIHGCFDELQHILKQINLSGEDKLYLVGDYIDRGTQSREVLEWLEKCPENVFPIKGNHDLEFAQAITLMAQIDVSAELKTDYDSVEDSKYLYETTKYAIKGRDSRMLEFFDHYDTIRKLIEEEQVPISKLQQWAAMLESYPFYYRFHYGDKDCVVVHAGFMEDLSSEVEDLENFYIYAREEAIQDGGIEHGMIIAGHNPTIYKDYIFYNEGKVFSYYDKKKDCQFFDIDCGSAYRAIDTRGKLACIRLDDEEVFYF